MSSLSGRLREVIAYESLDYTWSKFSLISIRQLQRHPIVLTVLFMWNANFEKKNALLPIEKFRSHVIPRNALMLQHLIQLTLYSLSSGPLQEVKNKRKFQTFSSESGRGRIWEVVAYKRLQI